MAVVTPAITDNKAPNKFALEVMLNAFIAAVATFTPFAKLIKFLVRTKRLLAFCHAATAIKAALYAP